MRDLVSDLYLPQIVWQQEMENSSQYNPVPCWYYNPMVFSKNNHPINLIIGKALSFQFTIV